MAEGERLACEGRAARGDRQGLATAHRTTSARAEARGALLLDRRPIAGSVPQRSFAGRLGRRWFGDSVDVRTTLIMSERHGIPDLRGNPLKI